MHDASQSEGSSVPTTDRRIYVRKPIESLSYVDLGNENGGLVLNLGVGGMAVRSAVVLATDELSKIRFQMPQTLQWVAATGRIAWTGDSNRLAGIEFIDLPAEAGDQIRSWMIAGPGDGETIQEAAPGDEVPPDFTETRPAPAEAEPFVATLEGLPGDPASPDSPVLSRRASAMLAALANKSRATSATPMHEVPNTGPQPRVEASDDALPESDHSSSWASSSILNLTMAARATEEAKKERVGTWLRYLAVIAVLAGFSFYLGISASRVGIRALFASAKNSIVGKPSPTAAAPSQPTSSAASIGGETLANDSATANSRASVPNRAPAQSPENLSQPIQPSDNSSKSFPVHRTAASAPAGRARASDHRDELTSVLNFPDTPVSASNSVAVSSRLYISLPEVSGSQGGGSLKIGRLEHRTEILYPPSARELWVEGIVKLHIAIGEDGAVHDITVLNGDSTLASAATGAINHWKYQPTLFEGRPIETEADLTVTFRLPDVSQ